MMRWIVVVLGLLSISLGFAQDGVPGNVSATAIAQDAFTLIWDEVEGASGYEVEVYKAYHYFEDFDEIESLPEDWELNGCSISVSEDFTYSKPKHLRFYENGAYLQSPLLQNLSSISFMARQPNASAKATFIIQTSTGDDPWTNVRTLTANENNTGELNDVYSEHIINVDAEESVYFRFFLDSFTSTPVTLDNLEYTLKEESASFSRDDFSSTVARISGLASDGDYICRVKANTDGAEFSNWLNVTTRPQHTSSAGNSSIAGGAATISLSPNGGAVSHDITIDPSGEGPYHYTASVESIVGGYRYTIDDGDSGGLAGEYTINHPGFTTTDCTVEGGSVAAPNAGAGRSSFSIDTVGKGAITITLMGGDTLPVSISAFEISYAAQGVCHVSWASAAESGMLGYYVKCSADSLYEHMSFISSLIPAHNESQPRSYQYIHENPPMPGWYWLVAAFMNGEEDIYGPVTQDMPYDPGVSNPVYQNSVLIYPNPFGSSANLRLNLKKDTQIDYKIYNIKGQLLKSGSLGLLPEGTTRRLMPELSIDGKPLNNGVYLLKLEGAGLDLQTRFVISK